MYILQIIPDDGIELTTKKGVIEKLVGITSPAATTWHPSDTSDSPELYYYYAAAAHHPSVFPPWCCPVAVSISNILQSTLKVVNILR